LHVLDQQRFGLDRQEEFMERFGNMADASQVTALHETLKPYMLRRLKEDVETLPEALETIIEVELTMVQKKVRAIYTIHTVPAVHIVRAGFIVLRVR
jgi:SNF2 family DNA or RNA helicase